MRNYQGVASFNGIDVRGLPYEFALRPLTEMLLLMSVGYESVSYLYGSPLDIDDMCWFSGGGEGISSGYSG